jgi:hypothetical protein
MERITDEYSEEARRKKLAQSVFSSFTVIGCIIYSYRARSASGQTAFALDVDKSCEPYIGPLKCTFDVSHSAEYGAGNLIITESDRGLFAR